VPNWSPNHVAPGPETGFEEIGIALPRTGPLENLASRAKAR
jgi:hypothetical protein